MTPFFSYDKPPSLPLPILNCRHSCCLHQISVSPLFVCLIVNLFLLKAYSPCCDRQCIPPLPSRFLLPPLSPVVCSLSLFLPSPHPTVSLSKFGSMPGQEEALLCPLAQGAWEKPSYLSITVDFPIAACVFCSYAVTFHTAKAGSHHRLAPATTPASLFCFYTLSWTLFSQRLF